MIGQRVVIRRLVPGETGPTGGPAFTDLLGVCTAWAEGTAVVAPETGPPVSVPIADIVSGKPVPPRPSIRQWVSVAEAEARTAGLFANLEAVRLGEWTLRAERASHGSAPRRANSCLALGDPGSAIDGPHGAAEAVRAFYTERGRTPYVQVEAHSDTESAFRTLGWTEDPSGEAQFLLASLARVRRALPRPAREAELVTDGDRATASVEGGCDPLAEGAALLQGDWLALHALRVDPGHRRRGLATAVLAALLDWGAERGAMTLWLHVETANTGALALYEGLGFVPHHTMRYLSHPT